MPQQVKESQSMDQQYFKEKIQRPLSATIPLSKAFSPCWPVPGRTYFGSLERMSFIMTAFASILIGILFS
jgi:hypothetical protein